MENGIKLLAALISFRTIRMTYKLACEFTETT